MIPSTMLLPTTRRDRRGNLLIERAGKTLAVVNPFGLLDWLDCGDLDPDLGLLEVGHEVHLSGCRGVQVYVVPALLSHARLDQLTVEMEPHILSNGDVRLVVNATSRDDAGNGWRSTCHATYDHHEWVIDFTVVREGSTYVDGGLLEITDIHPGVTGRGVLLRDQKRFTHTVITDANTCEKYPHQHAWHSGEILNVHQWQVPTAAAFVGGPVGGLSGELSGEPAGDGIELAVSASNADLVWAICDMYYDLHLSHRATKPIHANETLTARCHLRRIPAPQATALLAKAHNITGAERDYGPRIEAGNNTLATSIAVDRPDEAHHFLPESPQRQWAHSGGRSGGGRLHLHGDEGTTWNITPPLHLRPGESLCITAWIRGSAVELSAQAWTWQWPSAPGKAIVGDTIPQSRDATASTPSTDWLPLRIRLAAPDPHDHAVTAQFGFKLLGAGSVEICDIEMQTEPRQS